MKIRKIKVNIDITGHKSGAVVKIKCDNNGVPMDIFWRRRLKDSKIDNCVEWVENSPKPKKFEKGDRS